MQLSGCIAKMVGARLRELRLDAEMGQRQLARAARLNHSTVKDMESGRYCCSLEHIAQYAAALGLDIGTVLVCLDDDWIDARRAVRHLWT